jgi:DNA-binding response OmpR family regulator
VELAPKEFALLEYLLENLGRTQSHVQLMEAIWGSEKSVSQRALGVIVVRLRRALTEGGEVDPSRTVHGTGYVLGDKGSG